MPFWRILGVLINLKLFCMEASAMETVRAFTFPIIWVGGAAQMENSWHPTGDVFCMYWLLVTALAYFSFLDKIEKNVKDAKFHFKTFLNFKMIRYLASFLYKMRKMES